MDTIVAPALLVQVKLGPGLRTLETCNMRKLGGRKIFSNMEHEKIGSSKTSQHVSWQPFWAGGGGGNFYLGPTLTSCSDNSVNNQASTHCLTKQLRWDDLIQVVFNRALASSVGVKDCTLTSKDYFLGKTYNVFGTLKKHFKTSLAEYWGSG